jgi:hypothetical protein
MDYSEGLWRIDRSMSKMELKKQRKYGKEQVCHNLEQKTV